MRARSLGSHLKDPFHGLDGESGPTVHGAGLFLAGQVVARFARNTSGAVSVVESLADDSPSGGPGGARGGCSPPVWLLFDSPLWRGAAHAGCCANTTARPARSTGRLPSIPPAGRRSSKVIPMRWNGGRNRPPHSPGGPPTR